MKQLMTIKVNGTEHEVACKPNRTLLELLREDLMLTGTKQGCSEGDCGACVVLLDGLPVNSCLVLALETDGREVITIEGVASGNQLDPVQQAFVDVGAVQCGYCTPGMILVAKALLKETPDPTEAEIRRAISGNLCRCTGYIKIVEAIMAAAKWLQSQSQNSQEEN